VGTEEGSEENGEEGEQMSDDKPKPGVPKAERDAQEELAKIYKFGLAAKTFLLMAQGKPMDKDYPHTAVETTPEKSKEHLERTEVVLDIMLEKLDVFARSFDLPVNWWSSHFNQAGNLVLNRPAKKAAKKGTPK
jgi:hypothetical protein